MKKVVSVLLVAAMCLSLAACGKKEEKKRKKDRDRDRDEDETYETVISDETTEDTPFIDETEPDVTSSSEEGIYQVLSGVSEDRLWVSYGQYGETKALIDTDGNVLYSNKEIEEYTLVKKGIAFVECYSPETSKNYIVVLDAQGNEIKKIEGEDSTYYDLLAADGGKCLVYECTTGFSGNKHNLVIFDSKGEAVCTRDMGLQGSSPTSTTIGHGNRYSIANAGNGAFVFCISRNQQYYLAQLNVPSIVYAEVSKFDSIMFTCGKLAVNYRGDDGKYAYKWMPVTPCTTDAEFADLFTKVKSCDNLYTDDTTVLYDLENARMGVRPTYPSGVELDGYCLVRDGYAYIPLRGADGKAYFTVSDLSGKQLYEPQLRDDSSTLLDLDNGSLIFNDGVVLTTGEKVAFDKLPKGFSFEHDHYFNVDSILVNYSFAGVFGSRGGCAFNGGIFEGYYVNMNQPNQFQTINGSKVVTTVKF